MAVFPPDKYNYNSLYVLNNGWYIDFEIEGNTKTPLIKTPEGATWKVGDPTQTVPVKVVVDRIITELSPELNVDDLALQEIIAKQVPPPREVSTKCQITGRVVNKDGDPITRATVKATLIEFPPPPPPTPSNENPNIQEYTDFENTYFELGAALTIPEVNVNDNGEFTIEYLGDNEIDFEKSFVIVQAEEFFPKTVGPKLTKTGETTLTKNRTTSTYEGATRILDSKLIDTGDRQDGAIIYRAEVTLEDIATGKTAKGSATSIKRNIAQRKAESQAKKEFATVNEFEDTILVNLYDLGRINLDSLILDLEVEEAKLKIQVQEAENFAANIQTKSKLPFEVIIANIFNNLKENIKAVIFPAVIAIVSKFGAVVVRNFVEKKFQPPDDFSCPSREKVLEAIRKRNLLVRQLNNIYKTVRTITKILNITGALILGLRIAVNVAKFVPTPPFFPSGLTADAIAGIKKRLEIAGIVVNILTILATSIGIALGVVIQWLNGLDFLIQECAEEEDISFEEINREINSYIDPSTGEVEDIINPLTGKPFPYKGFSFEIKEDTSQNFKYPKRYAVARNIQGIQVLRSESSFASSPEILIEELKFVIDRDNLRAD